MFEKKNLFTVAPLSQNKTPCGTIRNYKHINPLRKLQIHQSNTGNPQLHVPPASKLVRELRIDIFNKPIYIVLHTGKPSILIWTITFVLIARIFQASLSRRYFIKNGLITIVWRTEIETGSCFCRSSYQTVVYGRQCSNDRVCEARVYSRVVRNILIESNINIFAARTMGTCMMNNKYGYSS